MQSTRSRIARAERIFSWRVVRIEGVERRMLMPSEALTASRAGMDAEKTNEGPFPCCRRRVRTVASEEMH